MFKVKLRGARNRHCVKPKTCLKWVMYHVRDLKRIEYVDPDGRWYWWDFDELTYGEVTPLLREQHHRHHANFNHFIRFMRRHFGVGGREDTVAERA